MTHVAPIGTCGGFVLAWRVGVELESFIFNKNITFWCYFDPPNSSWILSCIYGPPEKKNEAAFLDFLTAVGEDFVNPWLCIGDFNEIVEQSEKWGANPKREGQMDLFRSALEKCNLSDLGYSGAKFTWTNCQPDGNFIKVRLDRAVANTQWCGMFKDASVQVLPSRSSDHKPLFLMLDVNLQGNGLNRKGFKFEMNWTLEEGYQQVIEEA